MVTVADLDRPWELCDPRRDRTLCPYTDVDSARLVEEAVTTLVVLRAPMWLGDPGPTISVLVSVAGQANSGLYDAVAEARDQGYSWDQIASRLATSVAAARRRYASYSRWRTTLPLAHPDASNPPACCWPVSGDPVERVAAYEGRSAPNGGVWTAFDR